MGECSSSPVGARRVREAGPAGPSRRQKEKTRPRNARSAEEAGKDSEPTNCSVGSFGEVPQGSPLSAVGEILASSVNVQLQRVEQVVGVGCMISSRILLASDHYLHLYAAGELSFRPFGGGKAVRVAQCLYPPASALPKEKKRSMYLHKRISTALFLLESAPPAAGFLQLGTGVLQEQEQDSFQSSQLTEELIEETSRSLYLLASQGLPERGWPLLYKLFDKFYCIGLYSYPHTSDSLLLNDHVLQRFKEAEEKHCGTEEIANVEIREAALEMEVVVRPTGRLQDLLEELGEAEAEGEAEEIAEAAFRIGVQYGSMGNFPLEKHYYVSALELYLSCSHPQPQDSIAALYHNLGICESELGDHQMARLHLLKSLELKLQGVDAAEGEAVGDTYNELGVVARKAGREQQALEYYYKAYNIYNQLEYHQKMGVVLNNITLLTQEDQTRSASKAKYRSILAILARTKGENCIEVAEVLFNLARMEADCKNFGTAMTHLSRAAKVMKSLSLEEHGHYRRIVGAVEEVELRVRECGERKEWLLKSKALLDLV